MPRAKSPTRPARTAPAAQAAPGGKDRPERITLRDVAKHLGVSVATVSNAYNRPDQLSADLRQRVLQTARDLGYQGPDPLARSLRRGRTGVIGVVYDAPLDYAFADPAAALFLGSVAQAIRQHGLNLLLLASPPELYPDALPVRTASVDAFIVYCAAEGSELLAAILERRLPTVLVDQSPQPQPTAALVGIDDLGGARLAAEHLRQLGHSQIGVVSLQLGAERSGGPVRAAREAQATHQTTYQTTVQRLQGYREGSLGAHLQVIETRQNTPQEGENRARELLEAHPEITALLCMSDVLAQGAMRAARQLGRRLPQDLSVIGYDDLPASAALNLTTVWQPTADKGRAAGEALLTLLAGRAAPTVRLPTRLIVRGSTGPVPSGGAEQPIPPQHLTPTE